MGCTASRHLARRSSMEQCPSSPITPGCRSTCTTEYSVEYHQHIVALASSSYGLLKSAPPSESRDSSRHETNGAISLNEMYRKLISLEMTEPVTLQTLRDSLHSPLGRQALCSQSSQHEWHLKSGELLVSETIEVTELMMGFAEKAPPRDLSCLGQTSSVTITKTPAQLSPVVSEPRKCLGKPFHTAKEADVLINSGKAIQHGLDEDEYESGKENNGPEYGHYVMPARCPLSGSPLSQISQSSSRVRGAQEGGIPISEHNLTALTFSSIPEAKRKAAFKHGRTDPAQSIQQQRRKFPASDMPLSLSLSRRVMVKESFLSTESNSPLFDPDMVASYEEALKNISEDHWNACLVDSAEKNCQRASATIHIEQRNDTAIYDKPVVQKGAEERSLAALNCYALRCPPGGDATLVLYTTTLRGIRKTFEDCNNVRRILQSYGLSIDERDVSMHLGFLNELRGLMGRVVSVPRLFIKGRYIGGAEEVGKLQEDGKLNELLEGLPRIENRGNCEGCDGIRFLPCLECSGSCKIRCEDNTVIRCPDCNENGLIRCPICS